MALNSLALSEILAYKLRGLLNILHLEMFILPLVAIHFFLIIFSLTFL